MHSKIINKLPAIIIPLILAFLFLPKYIFAAQPGMIINEIMYDLPGTDDKHEWMELYNSGNSDIDLTGAKFNDGDSAANHGLNAPGKNGSRGSMILPPGGYLLLADDATQLAADLPNYAGPIIDTVINLSNTSATLKILDKDSNELAAASYNKNLGAAGNGKTLEWDGANFKESYADGGTPGVVNSVLDVAPFSAPTASPSFPSPAPATDNLNNTGNNAKSAATNQSLPHYQFSQNIFINEFLPYPAKGQKEWIELYNDGSETVNLTGWQVDDAQNSTKPQLIPDGTKIAGGEYLVVELSKNMLNNDGDEIRLLWPDDQVVHSISYPKAKQNIAYARFNGGWLATNQPTPGAANKKSAQQNKTISAAQDSEADGEIILADAPKIAARQDTVIADLTGATGQNSANENFITASPLPNIPDSPNNKNPPTTDLSADIQGAVQPAGQTGAKTALTLTAIIVLAGLSAAGLVYFKRKQTEKNNNS